MSDDESTVVDTVSVGQPQFNAPAQRLAAVEAQLANVTGMLERLLARVAEAPKTEPDQLGGALLVKGPARSLASTSNAEDTSQLAGTSSKASGQPRPSTSTAEASSSKTGASSLGRGRGGPRALEGRTNVLIKPPAPYKPSTKIVPWIHQMDRYMALVSIDTPEDQALALVANLSTEASERMEMLDLEADVWNNGPLIRQELLLRFADLKTPAAYRIEFRNARQGPKEDAGQFLDRVYYLASKATDEPGATKQSMFFNSVREQFIE